ncbi:hypothetical protein EV176_004211, partial [Coemansia sp. RSA 451]
GMDEFFDKIGEAVTEYYDEFRPNLQRQVEKKRQAEQEQKEEHLKRLMKDLAVSEGKEVDL